MNDQTPRVLTILGIETSCDETAAAVVRRDISGRGTILSNIVRSQLDDHAPYGGVVPEIAARAHVSHLDRLIARALDEAGVGFGFGDLDGVAATAGPGLIGGVIVGLMTAKAVALVHGLPLIAVNHLEGHALTARLTDGLAFPYLLLLVSGGHTQLLVVEGVSRYHRLGTTIDDALGEAFDKTAKLLGLGYPGGPAVERCAADGDPKRFAFPRPMVGREGCDFSFSGLKTASAGRPRPASRSPIATSPISAPDSRARWPMSSSTAPGPRWRCSPHPMAGRAISSPPAASPPTGHCGPALPGSATTGTSASSSPNRPCAPTTPP